MMTIVGVDPFLKVSIFIFWHSRQFLFSVHGSSISLVSTASSLYSTAEEKQAHEIRKLRRELLDSQEKVYTLTSQLSTNVSY